MRLATWNVEWFTNLFDRRDGLLLDDGPSGREGVARRDQAEAVAIVLSALDADALMVIEAPDTGSRRDTVTALESFARHFELRQRRALIGFANETQQEIALLYDPDRIRARHDPRGEITGKKGSADAPRFDGVFRWDIDVDAVSETITFSKPPLEVALELVPERGAPRALRLIGVHLKSKAPDGSTDPDQVMRHAIAARRKQLAQAIWLRQRVESHLKAGEPVIVLGDLNDGPGLDEYEQLFGRSSVEIVLGTGAADARFRLQDPHARSALAQRVGAQPATSRFYLEHERRYMSALLDYIMVSPDLCALNPRWRIWHPFDDPVCYRTPELREALLTASDHFPVSLDLDV
jgi:hypothetical protein